MPDDPTDNTPNTPDESGEAHRPEELAEKLIDLPSGGDLAPESAASITIAALTRLIIVAGEADSGKTTLLSTIYEKFNEESFAGLIFAGSKTLVGWERRCHLARIASGAEKPQTERTQGLQQRVLHLRFRNASLAGSIQDVLFTDLSGEVFKLIRDSTSECQQLGMLKRADHFVLLLDGEKLATTATRHEGLNNGMALLRSCVDGGMIGPHSFVEVVFSKYDLIRNSGPGTSEFVKYASDTVASRFGPRLGRLRFHNVAARPELPGVEYAFGMHDLLRSWVDNSPYFVENSVFPVQLPSTVSEFDNYLRLRLPEFTEICAWK